MERKLVYEYIESKKEYLFPNSIYTETQIENALINAPERASNLLREMSFRNPSTLQIIAVFPGMLGVDRFYMGEILLGFLKYITLGGCGIWWILDMVTAKSRCRGWNCKKLIQTIYGSNAL